MIPMFTIEAPKVITTRAARDIRRGLTKARRDRAIALRHREVGTPKDSPVWTELGADVNRANELEYAAYTRMRERYLAEDVEVQVYVVDPRQMALLIYINSRQLPGEDGQATFQRLNLEAGHCLSCGGEISAEGRCI